ncbi:MAG TPA: hypothetical protein VFL61_12675 [Gaiellaceae bacterium]|nr:hypothetical protein [Gaiellaceae bacterium]
MRGLLVACALVVAASAAGTTHAPARTTCHPADFGPPTRRTLYGNLDRDADLERVVESSGGCPHQSVVSVADRCGGRMRVHWLRGRGLVARLDLVEANGRRDGRELLFGFRPAKPAYRYRGNVGLVHLRRVAAGHCPRPVYLLSYFLRPPPSAAGELAHVELLRVAPRVLRLHESFARGFRETRFRYVSRADRYVRVTRKA